METIENQWMLKMTSKIGMQEKNTHENHPNRRESNISTGKQTAATTATAKEIMEHHVISSKMHANSMETIENQCILNITSKISTKGNNYVRKPSNSLRSQYKHKKANNSNNSTSNHSTTGGGGGTALGSFQQN